MECMLSTIDNPYDPFTQWDLWLGYDTDQGYGTCELFDRLATTTGNDELEDSELESAIDELVKSPFFGNYEKRNRKNV